MSDSTSWLRAVAQGMSPYAVLNALLRAASPAMLLAIDEIGTSGLTLAMYGGIVSIGGVRTLLANQTSLAVSASATTYVEWDQAGTGTTSGIRLNTSGWTGLRRLYKVISSASAITSWEEQPDRARLVAALRQPIGTVNFGSDANKTLTADEADVEFLRLTSVTLTATRDAILPLTMGRAWWVLNDTTGGQSVRAIGATGTGITIGNAKAALVLADGTNIRRLSLDA